LARGKVTFERLEKVANLVRERKRATVAELAAVLGVSYFYFKYSIVKTLLALYGDIVLVRENGVDYLVYRPQQGSGGS